jgi:hypothetical protein
MLRLHLATTLCGEPIALGNEASDAIARARAAMPDCLGDIDPNTIYIAAHNRDQLARLVRLADLDVQLAELGLS